MGPALLHIFRELFAPPKTSRNENLATHVGHEGIGHGRGAGTGDADPTRIACRDPTSLAYQELARKALAVERLAYRGKDTNVAAVKHRDSKD